MPNTNFTAQRISKAAVITLNGDPDNVFPLFGAFEERKWAEGWDPVLIYPVAEIIDEGTTFKTSGHGHDEMEFLWIVSKYEPADHLIQYLVSTSNRFWTVTVKCKPADNSRTWAEITYIYTGLNELGNTINRFALEKIYKQELKDWEEAINNYLGHKKVNT
jgi:hypothetical protein